MSAVAVLSMTTVFMLGIPPGATSLVQEKTGTDLKVVHARLAERVRHQLVMLPYYSLFDNLEFRIAGVDTVVLSGQVVRLTLKSDAARAVQLLEAVGKVVDKHRGSAALTQRRPVENWRRFYPLRVARYTSK